jgi:hypothetical protein
MLGLAAATKQQGLLFAPLIIIIGTRFLPSSFLPPRSSAPLHLRTSALLREGLFFALGFLAVMAPVAWWDSLRWQLQPSYLEQSLISYGGLTLVDPAQLVERLKDWAEILHYVTASPFLNILFLGGLPCLLLYDLTPPPSPQSWEGGRRGGPSAFFDVVLSAFVFLFLLGHWVLSFNVWDRYLLCLVPVLLILLARILWLASGALVLDFGRRLPKSGLRGFLTIVLLAVTLIGPALTAARSGYPIGGDHGAYDGIEAVADYFRDRVPVGSILYHHWLGWHYSFYMFDFPLVFRWYPAPEGLAEDASRVDDAQRYIVFPNGETTTEVEDALAEAGVELRSVYSTYGRDGSISFTVYRIEDRK